MGDLHICLSDLTGVVVSKFSLSPLIPFALSAGLLAASPWVHATGFSKPHGALTLAVFGDAPYGTSPADDTEFNDMPAYIASVNADADVSLAMHLGDIHSGKQYCTEAYDRAVFDLFSTFAVPLVYTPGDNEWTDCHKTKEGGGAYSATTDSIKYVTDSTGAPVDHASGHPLRNLELVRSIFFATPGQTLAREMKVTSQAETGHEGHEGYEGYAWGDRAKRGQPAAVPSDAKFVENVMWEQAGVVFATVNIPGGSNNDTDPWYGTPTVSNEQAQEVAERTGAGLRWLDAAFARAKAHHAKAVLIGVQADMWDLDGNVASHIANYRPFIDRLASLTKAFGKPVLLMNGDSHGYRSDNPMVSGAACAIESGSDVVACADDAFAAQPLSEQVPNFHRIVVHGSTLPLEWVKLTVDPSVNAPASANAFGPFRWTRMVQP